MQEKLDALVRTQAMQLFRQQGLHFTMQQVAEPLHISKKTIYTVYPSKEALLLDMVDHAFADIHRCKQEILAGSGTLQEKLDALVRTQAMQLFRQQGLHFTMQQVAEPLHISKKTIYTVYPSKETLLLDMVDHAFADIHRCKQEILVGSGALQEKLRAVIIAMPTEYAALDLRQMKELDEKYPVVAARVRSQLENGWEPTMALLEQAVAEGVMRPVSLPVLRQMITASIESFLADRSLAESGVQYVAVLEEMLSILLEGVLPR